MHRPISFIAGILILIGIAGLGVRLFKLDSVPPGISHDELEFVNNGYSLTHTGRDLYGKAFPIAVGNNGHVALPAYFSGVTTLIGGLNIQSARLLPAVLGTIEIFLVFGIALVLFRERSIAVWAGGLFSISVWSLKMSRVMFDPPVSLFLFLAGIFVFLYGKKTRAWILGMAFLALGFLSYYGAIFFTLPAAGLLIWYRRREIKFHKNFWVPVLIIWILTAGVYARSIMGGQQSRTTELIFNMPKITNEVVFNSQTSNAPPLANRIFVNKASVAWHTFLRNYLGAFSPLMIFGDGDPNRIYGLWNRGELELYLLPLVIAGSLAAYTRYRRQFYLILALIIIAPLTSGLSSPVYATRAFLLWPGLIWLAAIGAQKIWNRLPKYRIIFLIFMVYSLAGTMQQYFYRYPVYAAEMWFDSEHQLADYLLTAPHSVDIYGPENRQMFMEFFFYAQGDPRLAQASLANKKDDRIIEYKVFRFIRGCPKPGSPDKIQVVHYSCGPDGKLFRPLIVTRDKSNRVMWYISS